MFKSNRVYLNFGLSFVVVSGLDIIRGPRLSDRGFKKGKY